ncbi:MAG TPA: PKD domain-containing protein, partial [Thermoplasmata archaeon]|nr:PKD domain-containing protein [Thermoplasmata archaeon]
VFAGLALLPGRPAGEPASGSGSRVSSPPFEARFARATLAGPAPSGSTAQWSSVQVAFVLETTPYDGVYDPMAQDWGQRNGGPGDACGAVDPGNSTLCEESNGVPFFVANASAIATGIQSANPGTNVSFALIDYAASHDAFDNANGTEYHVDTPHFVSAASFGSAVNTSFAANVLGGRAVYQNSDLSDNILHSASITALYETIVGNGLNWSNATHHVVVWIGSTAPRDPNYPENYCVSPSDFDGNNGTTTGSGAACYDPACEPASTFPNGSVPACEAWVVPPNATSNDSIALLARTATACTASLGQTCTVDTIDYWNGVTDPQSYAWPTTPLATGGGPGGSAVVTDASHILLAGCDLAAATGGTWDGPSFYTCPDGTVGTLTYVAHGPYANPNSRNPTLYDALLAVGFGPVRNSTTFGVRIEANATTGPAPMSVAFTAVVSNGTGAYSIDWKFGDGQLGSGRTVDHTFASAGTYDVTATASNGTSQAMGLLPVEATGTPPAPLALALDASPGTGTAPLAVTLNASLGGGVAPYDLSLCFVTGPNATACSVALVTVTGALARVSETFLYGSVGQYTITGTLSDPAADSSGWVPVPVVATTTVVVDATTPLVADASLGTRQGLAPLEVALQVNVTGGQAPYSLQWSFGDGQQGSSITGEPTSHVYLTAGTFLPSVRVSDASGQSVSVALPAVHVSSPAGSLPAVRFGGLLGPDPFSMVLVVAMVAGAVLVIGLADLQRRARWRREGAALLETMQDAARSANGTPSDS